MPLYRSAISLLLLAPAIALADTTIPFTVAAGKFDRKNEPVRIPLQLSPKAGDTSRIDIKDKDKVIAQGQLTWPDLVTESIVPEKDAKRRDLVFILPELKANTTATYSAVLSDKEAPAPAFSFPKDSTKPGGELRFGDRPVMKYMNLPLDDSSPAQREETFKVFHHVYDPAGKFLITKGVGGQFTHHRGLFFGFMKTGYGSNTVDIWHCRGETHQADRGKPRLALGHVLGQHRVNIDWNGVGKKTFAQELRELTTYAIPGGTLIDFTSKLTPTGDDVKLDGDPQHAGFHFRASNEVADRHAAFDKASKIKDADQRKEALKKIDTKDLTIFIRPDGDGKPGTEVNWPGNKKHINLPWLAMSFVVNGKRFTTCYLDQPTNPKEARFSERAYGRFGSYFVTTVTKEKSLLVRYRLWIQEGQMKGDEVAALSKAFVEPVTVKLK